MSLLLNSGDSYNCSYSYPSPENSAPVVSVGEKTVNLFDISQVSSSSITQDGDKLLLNDYACSTTITPEKFLEMTGLQQGDTITTTYNIAITAGISNSMTGTIRFSSNGASANFNLINNALAIKTSTIPEDFNNDNYGNLCFYGANGYEENGLRTAEVSNLMIVKDSYTADTMPPYEPYGKYKIPVTVSGRNLFDISKSEGFTSQYNGIVNTINGDIITVLNTTVNEKSAYLTLGTFEPGTYYIGITTDYPNAKLPIFINGVNSQMIANNVFKIKEKSLVQICTSILSNETKRFANIQITKSDIETVYEPYHEPVTVPIFLDEPLRKVGRYADYITRGVSSFNFVRGVLNGSENWTLSTRNGSYCRFYTTGQQEVIGISPNRRTITSDRFNGYSWQDIRNATVEGIAVYTNKRIDIVIDMSRLESPDASGFKKWLASNNVNYIAVGSERRQSIHMPNLPTFPGTTIYSIDTETQPSLIETEYYSTSKGDF